MEGGIKRNGRMEGREWEGKKDEGEGKEGREREGTRMVKAGVPKQKFWRRHCFGLIT
jgi:hypothetical protein